MGRRKKVVAGSRPSADNARMRKVLAALALSIAVLSIAVLSIALVTGGGFARAEDFPSRPLTLIVPFPPGGAVDPIARILAEGMKPPLGQSIVIENVASGG